MIFFFLLLFVYFTCTLSSKGQSSLGPNRRLERFPGRGTRQRSAQGPSDRQARVTSGLHAVFALQRRGGVSSGKKRRVLRVRETDLSQHGSVADPVEPNSYRLGQNRSRFVFFYLQRVPRLRSAGTCARESFYTPLGSRCIPIRRGNVYVTLNGQLSKSSSL